MELTAPLALNTQVFGSVRILRLYYAVFFPEAETSFTLTVYPLAKALLPAVFELAEVSRAFGGDLITDSMLHAIEPLALIISTAVRVDYAAKAARRVVLPPSDGEAAVAAEGDDAALADFSAGPDLPVKFDAVVRHDLVFKAVPRDAFRSVAKVELTQLEVKLFYELIANKVGDLAVRREMV